MAIYRFISRLLPLKQQTFDLTVMIRRGIDFRFLLLDFAMVERFCHRGVIFQAQKQFTNMYLNMRIRACLTENAHRVCKNMIFACLDAWMLSRILCLHVSKHVCFYLISNKSSERLKVEFQFKRSRNGIVTVTLVA